MSRQRLRPSLEESSQIVCPRCSGQGTIRDIESLSLAVLRLVEDEALKDNTGKILAKIPVECATYLLNEKREKVDAIEQRRNVHVVIIPDPKLETPHYEIERVKDNDTHRHESNYKKSYELPTEEASINLVDMASSTPANMEKAAVQRVAPPTPRPTTTSTKLAGENGFLGKLLNIFSGNHKEVAEKKDEESEKNKSRGNNRNRRRYRGGQNRSRGSSQAKSADNSKKAKSQSKGQHSSDKSEKSDNADNKRSSQSRPGRSRGNRGGNRGNRSRQQESKSDNENTTKNSHDNKSTKTASEKKPSKSDNRASNAPNQGDNGEQASRSTKQVETKPVAKQVETRPEARSAATAKSVSASESQKTASKAPINQD